MLLLHLSDLHLSRYGERGNWVQQDEDEEGWEGIHFWQRWTIQGKRDRKNRPDRVRLIDPEGVVHVERKWPGRNDEKTIGALLELAMERHMTSAETLVKSRPSPEELEALLRVDRTNTNLRWLQLLDLVLPLQPDLILITGDMTDNGFGYGLIEHYLKPWIDRHRVFVVAGNHDTYDMIPRKGRRARAQAKEDCYREFARDIGCESNITGAYVRRLGDIAIVGLNSCKPPRTPLSASGEVAREQLFWLRELARDPAFRDVRLRICMVHHHLLRMPFELGRRTPIELAMRLRNAPEVMRGCVDAKINLLFNGHRHHGYMVQLPGYPTVISSPSSTLGCKSTEMRYVWLVELDQKYPIPRVHRFSDEPAVLGGEEPEDRGGAEGALLEAGL